MYKIVNNYFNSDLSNAIAISTTSTRGHHFKLFKHHTTLQICSNFYFNRINDWNSLSSDIVSARSIINFKTLSDNFCTDLKFTF